MIYFIVITIVLFIFLNHTVIFHPKIRLDAPRRQYTDLDDIWITKPNNNKLLVCLHGIYSTPRTFEDLAQVLVDDGWDIYAPALPASAISRDGVQKVGAWAWEESLLVIREKLSKLPSHYQHKSLCGHSQGGSLAMQIATEKFISFDSLIVIASPVNLYGSHLLWWENIAIYFAGILSFIFPNGLLLPIKNVQEREKFEKLCDAEGIQMPFMLHTFKRGLQVLRQRLYKIQIPLLLIYCTGDKLVGVENLQKIKSMVNSKIIEEKIYEIPNDVDAYTFKHQLLNHSYIQHDIFKTIDEFLQL